MRRSYAFEDLAAAAGNRIEIMFVRSITFNAMLDSRPALGRPYARGRELAAAAAAPFPTINPIAG